MSFSILKIILKFVRLFAFIGEKVDPPRPDILPEAEEVDEEDIIQTFTDVFVAKKSTHFVEPNKKKKKLSHAVDKDHFVPFTAADAYSEKGLSVDGGSAFEKEAMGAVLDLTMDDDDGLRQQQNSKKWDRKKKKFVGGKGNVSFSNEQFCC